jgi:type IV pilus assembly protein PilC
MATATAKKGSTARQINPLQTYVWSGKDKRGVMMRGEVQGKNINLVKADLRRQGIVPTKVATKSKPLFGAAGSTISAKEIAIFSRQIATMMKAGVPMVQSLEIIASGQKNPRMQTMISDLKAEIEGGSSLHEAMTKFPVQFDLLYRNLVKAGESAGVLDTVLDTVATYKERMETLKGKIKKALFYPATVIAVAIIVSAILLVFVVPQFENVFKQFGADLPAFTQMIVTASRFMVTWWWAVLIVTIGALAGFMFMYRRTPALVEWLDRLMLKLPVIGQVLHNSAIARFSRTLALTFKAGVPLVEALETVGPATGSIVYEKATRRIRDDVSVGYPLNIAMRQVNLFPPMVVQMTAIGEEAGALDTMLYKIADFYEQEVDNTVDALTSLLEPFIIVFIGVVVGGMVVAMYLPIFKLAATM